MVEKDKNSTDQLDGDHKSSGTDFGGASREFVNTIDYSSRERVYGHPIHEFADKALLSKGTGGWNKKK